MANGQRPARVGCCCERMSGYDEQTERLVVTRDVAHHCCPQHGSSRAPEVRRAPQPV